MEGRKFSIEAVHTVKQFLREFERIRTSEDLPPPVKEGLLRAYYGMTVVLEHFESLRVSLLSQNLLSKETQTESKFIPKKSRKENPLLSLVRIPPAPAFIIEDPLLTEIQIQENIILSAISSGILIVEGPTTSNIRAYLKEFFKVYPESYIFAHVPKFVEIVIFDLPLHIDEVAISNAIINITGNPPRDVDVRHDKNQTHIAVVMIGVMALRKLESHNQNYITIEQETFKYLRYVKVKRCRRCFQFGHDTVCCQASDHLADLVAHIVQTRGKCSNCYAERFYEANIEYMDSEADLRLDERILQQVNHGVFSNTCPLYRVCLAEETKKTYCHIDEISEINTALMSLENGKEPCFPYKI